MVERVNETEKFALKIRLQTMIQMKKRGFGHIGGCFSCADLIAVLYNGAMNIDPQNPEWRERDRLIVSKGHAGPTVYAALALKGYFPMDWLMTLNEGGTRLPSHCDRKKTPGIDFSTGSLGQGLSVAVGAAYGFRMDQRENDVYVLLGDGEIQEGQIWEAAMAAAKYKLNNLYCFIDANKYQIDGSTDEIMPLLDIAEKFRAFGWQAQEVCGHSVSALFAAIDIAKEAKDKPSVIVMHTVKGYGYEEISNQKHLNHHMSISEELGEKAIRSLKRQLAHYV